MGNFSAPTVKQFTPVGNMKFVVASVTGPASYDSGGSVLDLSSAATTGFGTTWEGFSEVYCVMSAGIAAANDKYRIDFVPASAGAAATGLLKVRDLTASSDAEASGDLSGVTFYLFVAGR